MLRRAIASGFLVVLVACAAEETAPDRLPDVGPDCVPVGDSLRSRLSTALLSGSIEDDLYATPSRINQGIWLVSAAINSDIAVWAVDSNPQADPFTGVIVAVNQGALAHSDLGVGIPEDDPAFVARERTEDPNGVIAAEGCVG